MKYKDDLDSAAEYVMDNLGMLHDIDANTSEGHQQAFDGANFHVRVDLADNNTHPNCLPFDMAENEDSLEQLMQPLVVASGQACLPKESQSNSLLSSSQNSLDDDEVAHLSDKQTVVHCSNHFIGGSIDEQSHCSFSEKEPRKSASEDDFLLHDDGSPDATIQSCCSVCLDSVDKAIATEKYKKIFLLSNMSALNEMLEEVVLNEAKTKLAVSEARQAGNDILVKVEREKEMSALVVEENKKMHNTLQRRIAAAEAERKEAEKEKSKTEILAQKSLEVEEHLLEAAKEGSRKLEQQAQNNAKLRELLMDRGHVVDALHGEMLEISDGVAQLQRRLDTQHPVDEALQLASSILSSSVKSATS